MTQPSHIIVFMLVLASVASHAAQDQTTTPLRETVLFPFDDYGVPFTKGLILTLVPGHKSDHLPSLGVDPKHLPTAARILRGGLCAVGCKVRLPSSRCVARRSDPARHQAAHPHSRELDGHPS